MLNSTEYLAVSCALLHTMDYNNSIHLVIFWLSVSVCYNTVHSIKTKHVCIHYTSWFKQSDTLCKKALYLK